MAVRYNSISDDFLRCTICFEPFSDPRILPCVHTFCARCLSKHIETVCKPTMRDPKFTCPTCRENVSIPDPNKPIATWGLQFRRNFMINSLRDAVETEVSYAATKTTSSGTARGSSNLCPHHPQKEMDLFCVDCDTLVCVTCIALSHRSCRQVITLGQVAQEKRRQLSRIHNFIEGYLSPCDAKKKMQMQELEKLKGQYEESKTRIIDASDSLQRLIIEEENTCLKNLETLFASHQQEQMRVINEADVSSKRLTDMLSAVKDVLEGSDDFRVVNAHHTMQSYQHTVGSMLSNEIQVHTLEFIRNMTLYKTVEQATTGKIGEVKSVAFKKEMLFLPTSISPTSSSLPIRSPTASSPASPHSQVSSTSSMPGSPAASSADSLAALTSIPVLVRSFSTKVKSDKTKPSLRDIAIAPGNVVVVTDFSNSCLKSFYTHGNTEEHSKLVLEGQPHAIAVIAGSTMVATIPKKKVLVIFSVTPNLLMQSSVYTDKHYWGISAVTSDVLAVSTCPGSIPGSLMLIDLKGKVLKIINSGTGVFANPLYLLTLLTKDIVITDCTIPAIVCLRQNGSMIFKCRKDPNPHDGMGFRQPLGLACDKYGNVVIVDKWPAVSVVSESGEVIQHILTKKEGLALPKSVAIDENNYIYIVEEGGKVLVFKPKC